MKPSERPLGLYKCCRCQRAWKAFPGPQICPGCEGVYVRWVNFDAYDWIKGILKEPEAREPESQDS